MGRKKMGGQEEGQTEKREVIGFQKVRKMQICPENVSEITTNLNSIFIDDSREDRNYSNLQLTKITKFK
jgi:hypothetical protein